MNEKVLSEQEFNRLINEYGTEILRLSYLYLKDYQLAEDACQDTFLKVYNKFHTFKGDSSEKTWITRICINVCKNYLRSSWLKRIVLNDKKLKNKKDLDKELFNKVENNDLLKSIMNLKPKYREVILMYYYQQFTVKEIAEILCISESNVYTRLSRARKELKDKGIGGMVYE
ncbi:RNA polymerase sigma-70 factor, ECF subfamily [Caminicella sporogenes DSM 14501]|uniref:RNA polymerase sigma-70 factor, ECF subfamily n=1 Tax=Caminicella sporogenes DSM 14501 TaxID=1121266 RepID=A0A1M6TQE3_9FIRM|nr:sigma-70 family RNA polymerase sigma factor [Caminicella sporogenes]RKD24759.1 RNA polymerase subunit sigma-24 [Caminicella sporogenes]SHK59164.1 RNA polymerase sigma-70 factor, ECF subfamily [Caminicella sporogenes DSM 14501]